MSSVFTLGALLVGCCLSDGAASAASPPNQPSNEEVAKAVRLVAELGDSRFRVRENAARELKKLGRVAKKALQDGIKSSDAEVWNRCSQLLPEILSLDLRARVDAYLADTDGKFKHEIPMLDRYTKICGRDAAARKLFAEIITHNADFLDDCEQNLATAGEKCSARAQEIHQQVWGPWNGTPRPPINVADIAALLLIGGDQEISKKISDNSFNPVASLIWQQPVQNALRSGELAPAYRKLLFAWADNRSDLNSISQVLGLLQIMKMKEGLEFAVKAMKTKEHQTWTRAQAIIVVGQLGGKEQIAELTALFGDKTQVASIQWNNVAITTQINDVALAMAIQLSGQSNKGYGFDAWETSPALVFAYHYLGFSSEERRSAAFKKWKEWSDSQKKDEPKKVEPSAKK